MAAGHHGCDARRRAQTRSPAVNADIGAAAALAAAAATRGDDGVNLRRGAAVGCLLAPVLVPCWGPVAGWKIWTAERFLDETRGCSISAGTPRPPGAARASQGGAAPMRCIASTKGPGIIDPVPHRGGAAAVRAAGAACRAARRQAQAGGAELAGSYGCMLGRVVLHVIEYCSSTGTGTGHSHRSQQQRKLRRTIHVPSRRKEQALRRSAARPKKYGTVRLYYYRPR
jgi:hypothetical protein